MKSALYVLAGVIIAIAAIAAIGSMWLLASWGWDVHNDRKHTVSVNSPTPVLVGSGDRDCNDKQQVTIVPPKTLLKVRRIRYWKDCATLDVTLPDGRTGYIILGDGDVSVNSPIP